MRAFIVFTAFLAFTQAAPQTGKYGKALAESLGECVRDLKLDGEKFIALAAKETYPEDDPEVADFVICYYKKLGIVLPNDAINEDLTVVLFQYVVTNVLNIKHPNINKIADEDIRRCQTSVPKGDSFGLYLIQVRNCGVKNVKEHVK